MFTIHQASWNFFYWVTTYVLLEKFCDYLADFKMHEAFPPRTICILQHQEGQLDRTKCNLLFANNELKLTCNMVGLVETLQWLA